MKPDNSGSAAHAPITAGVTRTVLPNGLTVLIKENHNAPVVSSLVSVCVGYFQEPDRLNGISHVIEHMLFKGTPKRPADEQFAREVRELGGTLNAATYYEETYYYVTVPSQQLEKAMELQADAFQNALFDAGELAKEIEVIVQESLQKRDNPNAMLLESLYELAYDTHRIRRWRIGHPETLRALTRDDLAGFYEQTYRPKNITFGIVGDIDTETTMRLVERYWGELPEGNLVLEPSPVEPEREGFRYRRMTGATNQRLLAFRFPAPPTMHPDAAALTMLQAVLSDGRSSRLFRRLREELKLVNTAWASYEGFDELGMFLLGAEVIGDDPLQTEQALLEEIRRLQREPVEPEALERLKTRMECRRLYAQEEALGMARTLTSYENLGDYHLADSLFEQLLAVTAEDVQRVANAYLNLSSASLLEYLPADAALPPELTPEELALRLEPDFLVLPSPPAPLPAREREARENWLPGEDSANQTQGVEIPAPSLPSPLQGEGPGMRVETAAIASPFPVSAANAVGKGAGG